MEDIVAATQVSKTGVYTFSLRTGGASTGVMSTIHPNMPELRGNITCENSTISIQCFVIIRCSFFRLRVCALYTSQVIGKRPSASSGALPLLFETGQLVRG